MGKQQNHYRNRTESVEIPDFNREWIISGIKSDAIEYAEKLGKSLADEDFTTSQIRNFYGELKRIQLKGINDEKQKSAFLLLHPKLAYAAKRAEKRGGAGASIFKTEILKAHKEVRIEDTDDNRIEMSFQNFCDLCEAILAFHKASGGRD